MTLNQIFNENTSKIYIDPYYLGENSEIFIKMSTLLVDEVYLYDPLESSRFFNMDEIKLLSEKKIVIPVFPDVDNKKLEYEKSGFNLYLTRRQLIDDLDFWFHYEEIEKNLSENDELMNKLLSYWQISEEEANTLIDSISWDYLVINILPNLNYILPNNYYQDVFNTILPYLIMENEQPTIDYKTLISINQFIKGLILKIPSNLKTYEIIYLRKRGVHKHLSKWFLKWHKQVKNIDIYSNEENVINRLITEFKTAIEKYNKKIDKIFDALYLGICTYNSVISLLEYSFPKISFIANLSPIAMELIRRKILKRNWMVAIMEIK